MLVCSFHIDLVGCARREREVSRRLTVVPISTRVDQHSLSLKGRRALPWHGLRGEEAVVARWWRPARPKTTNERVGHFNVYKGGMSWWGGAVVGEVE